MVVTDENRYSMNAVVAALDRAYSGSLRLVWGLDREGLLQAVEAYAGRTEWVAVLASFMTTQLADEGFLELLLWVNGSLRSHARSLGAELVTVAGGPHASGDPWGTLSALRFDYVLPGEAEEALPRFLDLLGEGLRGVDLVREASREGVSAVYYDGEVYYKGRGVNRVKDLDPYPPFPSWRGLLGPIEIMRGCPYACRYCEVSFVFGARPRFRSPENIERWVEEYVRVQEARGRRADVRFITPDSYGYARDPIGGVELYSFQDLVEALERVKLGHPRARFFIGSFPSEVRPDNVDEEKVMLTRRIASNKRVIVGAQSGSDRMLKLVNRGHTVDDVIRAVEILNRHGFRVDIDFIAGLPGETREDLEETIKLIEMLISKYRVKIHMHTFLPLPGTPLETAPPGTIPEWAKKRLFKLVGKGLLYGDWLKQEELAQRIGELRKKQIILDIKTIIKTRKLKYV